MANTKPGIELNEEDICQACYHREQRKHVDYDARYEHLEEIADEHRRTDGSYDCLIPVSGGKDSHYAVYVATELLDLNPLLLTVGNHYTKTEAGKHNIHNIKRTFDCDSITVDLGVETTRQMARIGFEELGYPIWAEERAIKVVPIQMAIDLDIPFIIYGENSAWEYGGVLYDHDDEEPYHAKEQIDNRVAQTVDDSVWLDNGVSEDDLNMFKYPSESEVESAGLEPIYLSYFIPWDLYEHYEIAKRRGFKDLTNEWDRQGHLTTYKSIDSIGYLVNAWLKYPKFGFARATDTVGYWRRSPHYDLSLEEGKELIENHDHKLDQKILQDFLDFTGYSHKEFWEIADSWRNEELFEEPFTETDNAAGPKNDFENISFEWVADVRIQP